MSVAKPTMPSIAMNIRAIWMATAPSRDSRIFRARAVIRVNIRFTTFPDRLAIAEKTRTLPVPELGG